MRELNCFLDTNIFLRVLAQDDTKKAADCEQLLQAISQGRIRASTSHIVLAEFVWTAQRFYHVPKETVAQLLDGISGIKHLKIREHFRTGAVMEYYKRFNVKFVDALLASDSLFRNKNVCMISYDIDFDTLGIKRYEPADIIRDL